MNKTDLHLLWVLLAGLGIGIIAYGVFKAIFEQAPPPPTVPKYMMRPEPPEEKFGYQFDSLISTPSLEMPLDFSLDPSGSLFFILEIGSRYIKSLYLEPLETVGADSRLQWVHTVIKCRENEHTLSVGSKVMDNTGKILKG